ncbi:MAG: hypothetical protein ABH934_02650 [Chloroflexota bacterium]
MPDAVGSLPIAIIPADSESREPFAQHFFVGGNSTIINILKDNIDELSLTASTANFEATLARLQDLLQNKTASISIDGAELNDSSLVLSLNIEQIAGHKFPTGFPSRRAWIHLTVTDARGNVVFESGKPDTEGGITGCDADNDAGSYEPHYDIISQPDQVQIYESIMQDVYGDVTYTLLYGAGYAKDNRMLPLGFDIENAVENIAIYGLAANDSNFIGGSDQITYQIDTTGHSGPFTIKVELLYQTISYQFAQDLFNDDGTLIDEFAGLYQEADKSPTLIDTISQSVS